MMIKCTKCNQEMEIEELTEYWFYTEIIYRCINCDNVQTDEVYKC